MHKKFMSSKILTREKVWEFLKIKTWGSILSKEPSHQSCSWIQYVWRHRSWWHPMSWWRHRSCSWIQYVWRHRSWWRHRWRCWRKDVPGTCSHSYFAKLKMFFVLFEKLKKESSIHNKTGLQPVSRPVERVHYLEGRLGVQTVTLLAMHI